MSESEKALELAAAVAALQSATVNLAQIERKIWRTGAAYSAAAACISPKLSAFYELQLDGSRLLLGRSNNNVPPSDLLDEAGLIALVRIRDEARAAVIDARRLVNDLGITCLG